MGVAMNRCGKLGSYYGNGNNWRCVAGRGWKLFFINLSHKELAKVGAIVQRGG